MGKFNKTIAGSSKVAMIHVSRDRDDKAAEAWAAQEGFPWMTILPDDVERSGMSDYRTRNVVPFYTLVDKDGKEIAQGAGPVFEKAAELAGKET